MRSRSIAVLVHTLNFDFSMTTVSLLEKVEGHVGTHDLRKGGVVRVGDRIKR